MRHINTSHWLAPRYLRIEPDVFYCPYCQKTWDRGGHKEGFVKASALRHVHGCWEVFLYKEGYLNGGWEKGKIKLYDVSEAGQFHPSFLRNVKSTVRRRARELG
jgi:hypothetical protein